jgi:hypothetical protein
VLACRARQELQRTQIVQQILLVLRRELVEQTDYLIGFRTMALMVFDGTEQTAIRGSGAAIVQEENPLS